MTDPIHFQVPTLLETPRLRLRPFKTSDAPELHAALVESIAALRAQLWFLPWVAEAQTLQSAEARCRRAEANFLLRTDLAYLAFDQATGRLVASVGLHRTEWDLPKTEVGYWVRSSEAGKGYVTEAVNAITAWALDGLGALRVELVTAEHNHASRAVAERCGFALEGVLRHVMRGPDGTLHNRCIYARVPGA